MGHLIQIMFHKPESKSASLSITKGTTVLTAFHYSLAEPLSLEGFNSVPSTQMYIYFKHVPLGST